MLPFLKRWRREKLLVHPFPEEWDEILARNAVIVDCLDATERAWLEDAVRIFVAEKSWEGCGGLAMSLEIQVTVAAQACLLLMGTGFEHDYFSSVESILVYPSGFLAPHRQVDGFLVTEGTQPRIGEAHTFGVVVLAWDEVLEDARDPGAGTSVVFHEFAHQLDMLDGVVDGTPPLGDAAAYRAWREIMTAEFEQLRRDSDRGVDTLLDSYGATDPGEFFAVATECFLDQPEDLEEEHPRLYSALRDYYHQDPAARMRRWRETHSTDSSTEPP